MTCYHFLYYIVPRSKTFNQLAILTGLGSDFDTGFSILKRKVIFEVGKTKLQSYWSSFGSSTISQLEVSRHRRRLSVGTWEVIFNLEASGPVSGSSIRYFTMGSLKDFIFNLEASIPVYLLHG